MGTRSGRVRIRGAVGAVCAITAAFALLLTGCVDSGPSFAVLDAEPRAADQVPDDPPAHFFGDESPADFSSARFVGEHNEASLWLMRDKGERGICLLAYVDAETANFGCVDDASSYFESGGPAGTFVVVADGEVGPDATRKVSENVYSYG